MEENIVEEWIRKRDWVVPVLRAAFEKEKQNLVHFKKLTFESYCQLLAMRFMMLLHKDPALWDFDLLEEFE